MGARRAWEAMGAQDAGFAHAPRGTVLLVW